MNKAFLISATLTMLSAGALMPIAASPAAACNRTAGCTMDVLHEGDAMMRDGRMTEAMRAGQENIQAFHRQQAADQRAAEQRAGRAPQTSR